MVKILKISTLMLSLLACNDPAASIGEIEIPLDDYALAPGDSLRADLINGSGETIGQNVCLTSLHARRGAVWIEWDPHFGIPPGNACASLYFPLEAGASVAIDQFLPADIPAGRYRLQTPILTGNNEQIVIVSPSFTVGP